ncbi:MAG: S-layer homology domain-containing protein [Bacillota bacterium]
MRKALVAALVVAFVLSIAATASAAVLTPASFPDVQGQACADAVAKLEALGIAKGIDGQWMPLAPVTRAQFAAFAVRLLGLEGVVKYMAGPTKFADVPATHWASGYVNVAVAKKLLAGYPDGNFHPDENITFPQAATVLGRVLGYVNLPGEWPSNYMVVASENGLFEGVEFGGDFVTRGDMAIMLWNALNAQLVQYKYLEDLGIWDYEKQWDDQDKTDPKTLLEKSLGGKIHEDIVVASTGDVNASLKAAEIKAVVGTDASKWPVWTMPEGVATAGLLGRALNTINIGTKVKYAEDVTDVDSVISGKLAADTDIDGTDEVQIKVGTTTVKKNWADKVTAYKNKTLVDQFLTTKDKVYTAFKSGDTVSAFLDADGKVAFIVGFKVDVNNAVITKVEETTTGKKITYVKGKDGATETKDVATNASFLKNGSAVAFSGLKAGDVADIALDSAGKVCYISASDAKVSGNIENVLKKADGKTYVVVGGTEYKLGTDAKLKADGAWVANPETGIASYVGWAVTLSLNASGEVGLATATGSAGVVGIVTKQDSTAKTIEMDTPTGKVTLSWAAGYTFPTTNYETKKCLALTTSDGKVTQLIECSPLSSAYTIKAVDATNLKVTVDVGGGTLKVLQFGSNAAIRLVPASGSEEWAALSSLKVNATLQVWPADKTSGLLYATTGELAAPEPDTIYGKYVGYTFSSYTKVMTLFMDYKGESKSYTKKDAVGNELDGLTVDDFVYAAVTGSSWTAADKLVKHADEGEIVSIADTTVTVLKADGSYAMFTVPKEAVVYSGSAVAYKGTGVGALAVGDQIKVYEKTAGAGVVLVWANPED